MGHLLEGALATRPTLMLPFKLMLLHQRTHRHMHYLLEQLVLLAALGVVAREVPLRLHIVLILANGCATRHLERFARERLGLGLEQPVRSAAELLAVRGERGVELVCLDLRLELLDALEDDDDVQTVSANADVAPEGLADA